jgi:CheY-like chemotaxis protein
MLTSAGERSGSAGGPNVDRCLTKPVRRGQLLEAVADAFAGEPEEDGEEVPAAIPDGTAALGGRVLIAEDNPVNRIVVEAMLRRRGLGVDVAEDGLQAVGMLRPEHRMVFMDCQMPNVDGYEATGRIRAAEGDSGAHVPIVAMTANALEGDREHCLRAGMDDYLSKPLRSDEVEAVLERWLRVPEPPSRPEERELPLLDDARVHGLREEFPDMAAALWKVFIRTTPPLLAELREALDAGDDDRRRRLAHKLVGSSETVGAAQLAALSRALEADQPAGRAPAGELEAVYARTREALLHLTAGEPEPLRTSPAPPAPRSGPA